MFQEFLFLLRVVKIKYNRNVKTKKIFIKMLNRISNMANKATVWNRRTLLIKNWPLTNIDFEKFAMY